MSQLDQFIQDFDRRQNAILAEYRKQANSILEDQRTLTRLLLLQTKGLSVIDQGDIVTKTQAGQTITNLPTLNVGNVAGGLTVRILDLKGAKFVRIMAAVDISGGLVIGDNQVTGILGYFSTVPNDTPVGGDFAFLGEQTWSQSQGTVILNDVTMNQFAEIPCATAKWLYVIFPISVAETDGWFPANNDFPTTSTYQLLA